MVVKDDLKCERVNYSDFSSESSAKKSTYSQVKMRLYAAAGLLLLANAQGYTDEQNSLEMIENNSDYEMRVKDYSDQAFDNLDELVSGYDFDELEKIISEHEGSGFDSAAIYEGSVQGKSGDIYPFIVINPGNYCDEDSIKLGIEIIKADESQSYGTGYIFTMDPSRNYNNTEVGLSFISGTDSIRDLIDSYLSSHSGYSVIHINTERNEFRLFRDDFQAYKSLIFLLPDDYDEIPIRVAEVGKNNAFVGFPDISGIMPAADYSERRDQDDHEGDDYIPVEDNNDPETDTPENPEDEGGSGKDRGEDLFEGLDPEDLFGTD
ncbi:MAG: hypothetical protein ACLFUO_05565 [Candidatus Woesearchaeota archaeon]